MSKPLDMADKYPFDEDDEPTVKIHVPDFFPKVIIDEDAGEEEPTLPSMRNPLLHRHHGTEKRYPGIGLALAFLTGGLFWGAVLWYFFA